MAEDGMALLALAGKLADGDFLREPGQYVLQRLMELEAQQRCGAGLHERSDGRVNQRNGYRERTPDGVVRAPARPAGNIAPVAGPLRRAAVEEHRERVARHRESLGGLGHRGPEGLEALAADECAGMGWIAHEHRHCLAR